ncbi:hypothetical protein [Ornithinimicrobium cryptoxanthini]|uniref:Oxidoreductase n=1 Tax=Ornithinimicrobium cryptoxanthini TaxID=2934161 RepID=A0ABY4YLB9_9MICO|nr:hypothetical protein [Ornithinimicrobium cryptoxanthini]USQ77521.1 hypothetical protein NF557_06330 [Ornithinimicrobium cryptoxanthini]
MAWWRRRGSQVSKSSDRGERGRTDGPAMAIDHKAVRTHFEGWIASHKGVEAYVEPATNVSTTTLILIATDGEWTRRAVGTPKAGFQLGRLLQIPVYDVNQTGYPSRMREWNRRHKK